MDLRTVLEGHRGAVEAGGSPFESVTARVVRCRGFLCEASAGSFSWQIDEPADFGGSGEAADPALAVLGAVGASFIVTLTAVAAFEGITLDRVTVDLGGTFDVRGFFGLDAAVRSGLQQIELHVSARSAAPAERVLALIAEARKRCPMLDNLEHPTPVGFSANVNEGA